MKYSVIAPALNEAENITPLVDAIVAAMKSVTDDYEIIIVDDGSTDGTAETLQRLTGKYTNLVGLSLAENVGQTAAFQAGFDYAGGERIITLDADLEKDPKYIPVMIAKLDADNLDAVYFKKQYKDVPWIRKFASSLANRFRRSFTGDTAADVGSTYIVYGSNIFAGRNYSSGFHRYFIGFMETEGFLLGYVPGDVFNRPFGVTKYTSWGRLKQGLADMFYYLLYKNRRSMAPKLCFVVGIGLSVGLLLPLPPAVATLALALLILFFVTVLALSVHALHLLVRQTRKPYRVHRIYGRAITDQK